MPKFDTRDVSGGGSAAAVGGVLGAIPFLNVIAPGIAATAGAANAAEANRRRLLNAGNIATPEYENANGLELGYSGDYDPSMFEDPEIANATMIDDSAEGRAAQLAALSEMQGMANQAADSTYALGRRNAEMDARQLASSREGAIRQDAMRRGQLGGAADMISRQQAAQAAANQNLSGGMQSANLQALQQLAGMQAAGGLAGQLRGQDLQRNAGNAGIANNFEMYNVRNQNDTSRANTNLGNTAQLRNLDARQSADDNKAAFALKGRQFNNQGRSQAFADQMAKFGAIDNIYGDIAGGFKDEVKSGNAAGAQGWNNFKDLAKMAGGGM